MSTSQFPVIKLFTLFLKQLSKPMAGYLKRKSKENYWLRTFVCMPPAQLYHRWDVGLRLWVSGTKLKRGYKIPPLSEQMAIDTGADMIGETFIFGVAAAVLYLEYHRLSVNAARREEQQDLSLTRLNRDVTSLKAEVKEMDDDLSELVRLIEVASNSKFQPIKPPS